MAVVYVVDDNELLRDSLRETLKREAYEVETFAHPLEALEALKRRPCHVVVSDLKMPGPSVTMGPGSMSRSVIGSSIPSSRPETMARDWAWRLPRAWWN